MSEDQSFLAYELETYYVQGCERGDDDLLKTDCLSSRMGGSEMSVQSTKPRVTILGEPLPSLGQVASEEATGWVGSGQTACVRRCDSERASTPHGGGGSHGVVGQLAK